MSASYIQKSLLDTVVALPIAPVRGVVDTSHAAAASVSHNTGVLRSRVLHHVMNQGEHGATADEIQRALDLAPQTVTPRCLELRKLGLLERTEVKRPTIHGRLAYVYIATPLAWQLERTPIEPPQPSPTPAPETPRSAGK